LISIDNCMHDDAKYRHDMKTRKQKQIQRAQIVTESEYVRMNRLAGRKMVQERRIDVQGRMMYDRWRAWTYKRASGVLIFLFNRKAPDAR